MELLLTFSGTHHAIRCEQVLQTQGVFVKVMSLPPEIDVGCGICMRVLSEELAVIEPLLAKEKIVYEAVFCREEGVYRPWKH